MQKLISRLMLLFNVASSKLWIKLLACRWQVAMLDLQVLSGNQSRHSCNRAALSQPCSLNAVQWLQKKWILVTMSVGIDIFCSYHILLTHIYFINIWFHSLCNGLQLPEPGERATRKLGSLKVLHAVLVGWAGLGCLVCTPLTISRLATCACAGELYWLCSFAWRTVNWSLHKWARVSSPLLRSKSLSKPE